MKKFWSFILAVCIVLSLTSCSNELELMEGKYYYEDGDDYIELFLDGTYEMHISWRVWWDEQGKKHQMIKGKYKVFKGSKDTYNHDYIMFYYPEEVVNSKNWEFRDWTSLFIFDENTLSEYSKVLFGVYTKK